MFSFDDSPVRDSRRLDLLSSVMEFPFVLNLSFETLVFFILVLASDDCIGKSDLDRQI